jgi:hypothetical protein
MKRAGRKERVTEVQKQNKRPIGGLIIAGASLALLFGIAILKARVR